MKPVNWPVAYLLAMSVVSVLGCSPARVNEKDTDPAAAELKARVRTPQSSAKFPLRQPRHPESLRDKGGIVGLHLYIDETGRPRKGLIGKSSGYAEFDESARDEVGTWRVLPGTVDGVPTAMWNCYVITFHPNGGYKPTEQDAQQLASFDQQCKDRRLKLSDLPPRPAAAK